MRSGSSISSEAEHRNERQANETALLSDYKLRSLAETGRIDALCVGVRSDEGPEAIEREADLVVDGPEGVSDLLRVLA